MWCSWLTCVALHQPADAVAAACIMTACVTAQVEAPPGLWQVVEALGLQPSVLEGGHAGTSSLAVSMNVHDARPLTGMALEILTCSKAELVTAAKLPATVSHRP